MMMNDVILLCMHVCLSHVKYVHEMWEYNMLNVKITGRERKEDIHHRNHSYQSVDLRIGEGSLSW